MLWVSTQTVPLISAELGLLQSRVAQPDVQLVVDANKLLRRLQSEPNVDLVFRKLREPVGIVTWSDSALANRPDQSSTGGALTAVVEQDFVAQGDVFVIARGELGLTQVAQKVTLLKCCGDDCA